MRFAPQQITLQDGSGVLLRSPEEHDAEAMLHLLKTACAQTHFLMREPEDAFMTLEEERQFLRNMLDDPRSLMLSAFVDGQPIGNASFMPEGTCRKVLHRADFGIAILQEYWGRGIGSALLERIIRLAREAGYEQLELQASTSNVRGLTLYKKFGFVLTGTTPHGFKLPDGSYMDECEMVLML